MKNPYLLPVATDIVERLAVALLLAGLSFASGIEAKGLAFDPAPIAAPPKAPRPFDMVGLLEDARLDIDNTAGTCASKPSDPRLAGGSAKINGITITIPCNTVLQMPATSISWYDLFYFNPAPSNQLNFSNVSPDQPQTGLALVDNATSPSAPVPPYSSVLPSYEVHIQGNIVDGRYIAGLVFVSQELLNSGQGTIQAIDYQKAQLLIKSDQAGELIRVRINDPVGRFGKAHASLDNPQPDAVLEEGYDPRFTADTDNPTIRAITGYPMCIPRTNPFSAADTEGDDPLCPEANRPRSPNCPSLPTELAGRVGFQPFVLPPTGQYCTQYVMAPPSSTSAGCSGPTCPTDPTRQTPFEVGDFVNYSGTLKMDQDIDAQGIAHPYSYISAHTIVANLGIYTAPGYKPVYVALEETLVGTNALPIANLPQETTSRVRVEGFTTDPTQLVDIFMVDVNYLTGVASDRLIGTENPGLPPVVGRFRFQPAAGSFGPFTRDIRVVSRTACRVPSKTCASGLPLVANGIQAGQFRAPNFDFIFPEPVRTGDPMVPSNFQDLYFLYCGSGPLSAPAFDGGQYSTPLVGPLDPAPWAPPMTSPLFYNQCPPPNGVNLPLPAPLVTVTPDQQVLANATVSLSGTATDPLGASLTSFKWTQIAGTPVVLSSSGSPASSKITFKAPSTSGVLSFMLSVTNSNGQTGVGKVSVAVNPDVVTIHSAKYDNRNGKGILTVVASSSLPATTSGLTLSIQASNGSYNMASGPQNMSIVANSTATAPCPAANNPCWLYNVSGVIASSISKTFLAPTSISVGSTMGGKTTIGSSSIIVQ